MHFCQKNMNVGRRLGIAALLALFAAPLQAERDPFADFITPVSNPVNFEDPRAKTEVRPIYVYHKLSDDFGRPLLNRLGDAGILPPGTTIGGDAHVAAIQARLAIGDRFAFIATKDGYTWLRPDNVLEKEDGWNNIGFGLKYAFWRDVESLTMATAGIRYEAPSGNTDVFQGQHPVYPGQDGVKGVLSALGLEADQIRSLTSKSRGDGSLNPFLSGMWGFEDIGLDGGDLHIMGYTALRFPISGYDSTFYDLSMHVDYGMDLGSAGKFFPLIEANWVHTVGGGRRWAPADVTGFDQEGFDFFNFGASGGGGDSVVTMAFGFRYRFLDRVGNILGKSIGADIGAAYEVPITKREDVFGWRVTTDLMFYLM